MEQRKKKRSFSDFLEMVMNMAGLNVLFLLFSLPLITGGASLTALYAGLRAMIKKEPCFRAFFQTFRSSFVRATAAWLLLLIPTVPMVFNTITILYYRAEGYLPALVLSAFVSILLMNLMNMVFLFYSRFECTLMQLFKHSSVLAMSYPLRILLVTVLMFVPVALGIWAKFFFFMLGVVWLFFYFSVVAVGAIWLMNYPFARFAREALDDTASDDQQKEQ